MLLVPIRSIEQLNGNFNYQMFYDFLLSPGQQITNYKIVSQIRCELADKLDIGKIQETLASTGSHMKELDKATTYATCYESSVRYPTNQKSLWEAVDWSYYQMKLICKYVKQMLNL